MNNLMAGGINVVDVIILVIFFISILLGLARGFISEVLSLVVVIASFIVAILFTESLTAYFSHTATMQHVITANPPATMASHAAKPASYMLFAISFLILFLGTLIIGSIIKMIINAMLDISALGFGNRVFGGLFGVLRGYLLNLFLIFLIQLSPLSSQPWWKESKLVPAFQSQVLWLGSKISPVLDNIKTTFHTPESVTTTKTTGETTTKTIKK